MANSTIPALPRREPLVDDAGLINQRWLIALQNLLGTSNSTTSAGGAAAAFLSATLSGASTSISTGASASPADGTILLVELTQDATGGRTITWGTEFATDTPTDISPRAGAATRFLFAAYQGTYRCFAFFAQP